MTENGDLRAEYSDGVFKARVRDLEIVYGGDQSWAKNFPADYKPVKGIFPSEYLIAAVGGCALMHAAMFCKKHDVPCGETTITVSWKGDAVKGEPINTIIIEVKAPQVPKKFEQDLITEIKECTVVSSICLPPRFEVKINLR